VQLRPIVTFALIELLWSMTVVANAMAATPDRIVLPSDVTPSSYEIAITPNAQTMSFAGSVKIVIDVKQPTRSITLNAAELTFDKVALDEERDAPSVSFDTEQQTATLQFATPVGVGRHVLAITYGGKINPQPSGLFALDYTGAQGKKRALFTQFENSDARRFVPSWDEPAQKATFALTAVVPADEMAVSNMPIASTETLAGGVKRVHFMTSPKMSSYLLFFASGDFERVARSVNGVEVGVVVKRGDADKARFALDTAERILAYYEDYFGVKYPLPKLDLIAAPGSSQFFSAMENWGAILYFERALLIDPKISTQRDARDVFGVVAHEMAHQWFGDLVTMAWWDDLWLNEGFASWMAHKAADHFHPEWTPWLDAQNAKEIAMRTDARRGTHPIIQPIHDVLQANQAFDEITYLKGEAVIRMLENYVGEEPFRTGVSHYLEKHAYGNTVSDDLWAELDKVASARVTDIAHDFTRQAGVPLVRVVRAAGAIRLSQSRFTLDPSADKATRWRIPVVELALASHSVSRDILAGDTALMTGSSAGAGMTAGANTTTGAPTAGGTSTGVIVNEGQAGYFRTLYSPDLMRPLISGFPNLTAADELGLINDTSALGYAGDEWLSDFLELAAQARPGMDPMVTRTIVRRLQDMDRLYDDLPGQPRLRAFGRRVLGPIFAGVGWTPRDVEPQNVALLRDALLDTLSQFDDPDVIAKANAYFAGYVRDPSSLSVDLRHDVLDIVALHADEATWEKLHTLAKTAPSALESQQFYELLGTVRDRELAQRALRLAVSDEPVVTSRPDILSSVSHQYPEMTFDFVIAHLDPVLAMLEPDSRSEFLPMLAGSSHDAAMIPKLRAYAAAHIPANARQPVAKVEALIAYRVVIRRQRLHDVDTWLKSHPQ
jgi:aminopeptidase N